jgi:hypothetical protein
VVSTISRLLPRKKSRIWWPVTTRGLIAIQKPVDFDPFRETVKTVGLYWLGHESGGPDQGYTS